MDKKTSIGTAAGILYLSEPILLRLLRGERRDRVPEPPPVLGQGLVARAAPLAEPPGPPPDVPPHVPRQQPLELLAPDARPLPAVEELLLERAEEALRPRVVRAR